MLTTSHSCSGNYTVICISGWKHLHETTLSKYNVVLLIFVVSNALNILFKSSLDIMYIGSFISPWALIYTYCSKLTLIKDALSWL